jgi:hypothetical protein
MNQRLRVIHDLGHALTIFDGNDALLTYCYDGDRFPYCHPVNLPGGGPSVTLARPYDHPWHLGLFFAWKYVGGVNVWEGRDAGEPSGRAQHIALTPIPDGGGGAGLRHALLWITADGRPLLRERRTLLVRPPQEGAYYAIDWQLGFAPAAGPITLERTVEGGGYAGLTARLPRSFHAPQLLNALGQTDQAETHQARAAWADYSGPLDGLEEPVWGGLAIIDHPGNPRHPSPWLTYNTSNYQLLNAALLREMPLALGQDDELHLAYRVVVHWGAGDAGLLDALAAQFAAAWDELPNAE